jgi:hypothetical protein
MEAAWAGSTLAASRQDVREGRTPPPQSAFEEDDEEDEEEEVEVDALELLEVLVSAAFVLDSVDFAAESPSLEEDDEAVRPLADADDERESVTYQPLPLNTMPTGWMTLRSVPPHCSQVVRGASEKL